jgi:hypothetical protein
MNRFSANLVCSFADDIKRSSAPHGTDFSSPNIVLNSLSPDPYRAILMDFKVALDYDHETA